MFFLTDMSESLGCLSSVHDRILFAHRSFDASRCGPVGRTHAEWRLQPLSVYNLSILALQPANTPYHPSGPYRDLRSTADTRHSYYVCAPAVMVTPAHDDRERTLRLRIRLITPVSHDARYAASGTSISRSSSTYVYIYRIFFSRHASWARVRFGQPTQPNSTLLPK